MRQQHIIAKTRYMAHKLAPWAAKLAKVDGGYRAFESVNDYRMWRAQK